MGREAARWGQTRPTIARLIRVSLRRLLRDFLRSMRNAFAKEITRLSQQDSRVVLLSGDIGNRLFDDFKAKSPERFYNCGVAESNMVGVAAGMAMSGLRP